MKIKVAKIFMGEHHFMKPVFDWLEKFVYHISVIKSLEEMNWKTYMFDILFFQLVWNGVLFSYSGITGIFTTQQRAFYPMCRGILLLITGS